MMSGDVLYSPFHRRIMNVNADITALLIEKMVELQCHQPAAAAYVENRFVRTKADYLTKITKKFRAGSFKAAQRADVSAQSQWRKSVFALDCSKQIIEGFHRDKAHVSRRFQAAERQV